LTILIQKDFEVKKKKKKRKKEGSKRIEETKPDRAKNEVNHVFSHDLYHLRILQKYDK